MLRLNVDFQVCKAWDLSKNHLKVAGLKKSTPYRDPVCAAYILKVQRSRASATSHQINTKPKIEGVSLIGIKIKTALTAWKQTISNSQFWWSAVFLGARPPQTVALPGYKRQHLSWAQNHTFKAKCLLLNNFFLFSTCIFSFPNLEIFSGIIRSKLCVTCWIISKP